MTRATVARLLLLVSLLLAACAPTPRATSTLPTPASAVTSALPTPPPAATATPPAPAVTLTDALGRTVRLESLPQRITVAGRATVAIVDALYMFPAASQRVVAMTRSGQGQAGDFIATIDPAFDQKALLDREPGPEQVAATQPDVVVLKSFLADSLGAALEALGIPVIYVDLETPEQYERDLRLLGALLGDPARAEEIIAFYRAGQERVAQGVAGLTDAERPRVLLLQASEEGGTVAFKVPPASWIQTSMVEMAGGIPVWREAAPTGGWTVVGFEQIAAWDPDQVYIVNYLASATETVAALQADPQWQALRAVQEGHLYPFPADFYSWDQPDPRWVLGLTWLATRIHPDRFADVDIARETTQFFTQMYGLTEAQVDEVIMPRLSDDLALLP